MMLITKRPLAVICTAALLAAASLSASAQDAAGAPDDVIATVNDTEITRAELDSVAGQLGARGQQIDQARLTDELVNMELMRQEAVKRGLEKDPEVQSQLELLKKRVLANAAVSALNDEISVSEDDVKQEYETQVAQMDLKEFKASHILLEDEESAKAVIAELNDGADFAETAKAKSTGPSGPNGGDLGWFNSRSMVPEFSAAVAAMEKGAISDAPVKTQFGYHVILLEDIRETEPPQLEQVRGEIEAMLKQKALSEKIDAMRESADIELK
ncbi:peptidylprolyl isomerase [Granulosicoccaceae sp. 1_MG-2023]|nr:peptidylprolyl isomerase [Granulosicoccaceae sp. 1_MG-2023]